MANIKHADQIQGLLKHSALPEGRPPILSSWQRCVENYGLDPHHLSRPTVISSTDLHDYRLPVDDLLALAKDEVDRLFLRLRDYRMAVTFTNQTGVTLLVRCSESEWESCRSVDLIVGSVWAEESQGTNGVGTCIKEGRPISIVMDEHFSPALSTVSCAVAPILGAFQNISGLLNVTTSGPTTHSTQDMLRDIVHRSARRIENVYFDRRHDNRVVFRLSRQGDFNDLASEERVAIGTDGRIFEATAGVAKLLRKPTDTIIGLDFEDVLKHGQPMRGAADSWPRMTKTSEGAAFFFRPLHTSTPEVVSAPRLPSRAQPNLTSKVAAEEFAKILGGDPVVVERFAVVQRLVNRRLPVLLQGETGTGKSTLAKILHRNSTHAGGAFVSLNCAAIPPELIESELFGYRSGAFTGASKQGYKGRLLEADGGTLFLDEIGDMPLALQTRFLHVLSDGEFVPIGSTQSVKIQLAVISASLHDIASLVREGRFREDLYFRLNGATRTLPALRQRNDRKQIIEQVFYKEAELAGHTSIIIDPDVFRALNAYHWPGNMRELQHVARFAMTVSEDGHVTMHCLSAPFDCTEGRGAESGSASDNIDRRLIRIALDQTGWNVSDTAKRLGISRSTLHRKIKALGLMRADDKAKLN